MKFARTLLLAAALICCLHLVVPTNQALAAGPNPVVVMETSMGRIMVMLYPKETPKTVANFLKYVDAGFYDKTVFHRVIQQKQRPKGVKDAHKKPTTMNIVQGGGYNLQIRQKPALFPPIVNEAGKGLLNKRGTLAMARTEAADSATSEFFFNVQDNLILDRKQTFSKTGTGKYNTDLHAGYCAFGKVIRGMDVVEKINEVKTVSRGKMKDVPAQIVILKKAYRAR